LAQTGLGVFSACLALYAWRSSKPTISPSVEPRERRRFQLVPAKVGAWFNRVNVRQNDTFTGPSRDENPRVNIVSRPSSNGNIIRPPKIKRQRRSKIFGWARHQTHQVQLTGAEEHSCPFCLETVSFSDPRGVEICSVCNTHHHADCWEVTGTCQIPHIQD
jgi:hypothetical protein